MKIVNTSAVMKPAFFVVVHHQRRCVVMGIRGTHAATDVLTDLNPHSEPFEGGYAFLLLLATLIVEVLVFLKFGLLSFLTGGGITVFLVRQLHEFEVKILSHA